MNLGATTLAIVAPVSPVITHTSRCAVPMITMPKCSLDLPNNKLGDISGHNLDSKLAIMTVIQHCDQFPGSCRPLHRMADSWDRATPVQFHSTEINQKTLSINQMREIRQRVPLFLQIDAYSSLQQLDTVEWIQLRCSLGI